MSILFYSVFKNGGSPATPWQLFNTKTGTASLNNGNHNTYMNVQRRQFPIHCELGSRDHLHHFLQQIAVECRLTPVISTQE